MKLMWLFLILLACESGASEIKELDRWDSLVIGGVAISPERGVISIYSDKKIHTIAENKYFLLVKGYESRPGHPLGRCGAGQEMYADIYQVEAKKATRVQRIMVISCWRSLELSSWQKQEDFSSITWNKDGVMFDWIVPPKFTNLRAQLNLNTVSPELVFTP